MPMQTGVDEYFFWFTWVVPEKGLLNSCSSYMYLEESYALTPFTVLMPWTPPYSKVYVKPSS